MIYPLEQLRDFDLVSFEHDVLVGLAYLAQDILSQLPTTVVGGFAAAATSPASLSINLGPGRIYSLAAADSAAAGSVPQDLTNIVQQGINMGQTVTLIAPPAGQSQWNLIQVQFQQLDAVRTGDPNNGVVPFYNASNPAVPSYTSVNTVRQGKAVIQVVQGTAVTTGSEVPPQPTSGWTPLYLIDLAGGQTTISTSQVITAKPSAGTGVSANYPYAPFLAGLLLGHHSGNPGQASQINLAKEVQGVLPYANMSPVRQTLFAPLNMYVDAGIGNDNNNGLTPTTAMKTIQAAVNRLYSTYDLNGQGSATINVANGTYTANTSMAGLPVGAGSSPVYIVGNITTPGSCAINVTNGSCFTIGFGAAAVIRGFTLTATGTALGQGFGIVGQNNAIVAFDAIVFASCAQAHIGAATGSDVFSGGTLQYTITGGGNAHILADPNSVVSIENTTVSISGGPTFNTAFIIASRASSVQWIGNVVTGAAAGVRYSITFNANINTNTGGNLTALPGSANGTTATGGVYA